MKLLVGTLYFLLIMLIAVLLASLFAPSYKAITRTTSIDAPVEVVYGQLVNLKKWSKWDAWYPKDLSQVRTFEGSIGDQRHSFSWTSSHEDLGSGSVVIKRYQKNENIYFVLSLINNGREYNFEGDFRLKERNGQTIVTWTIRSKQSYPFKIINYFIEKFMGPDFTSGLANLKTYIETSSDQELDVLENSVVLLEEHGIVYAMIQKDRLDMAEVEQFCSDANLKIYSYLKASSITPKGVPTGLFYERDTATNRARIAAGIPTTAMIQRIDSTFTLETGTAEWYKDHVSMAYKGGYQNIKVVHNALQAWLKQNGKTYKAPAIEEYINGPLDGMDSSKYLTRVSYYFK